jgi:hypothetical protein
VSFDLTRDLKVDEAHDLGLQLVRFDDNEEGLAYVTIAYWRCDECDGLCTITSKTDRRLLLELKVNDPASFRFNHDHEAVQAAKASHRCPEKPA